MEMINDVQANMLIEEIRDVELEKTRLEEVTKARVEMIQRESKEKIDKCNNEIDFKKAQLRAFLNTVKTKDTKTLSKYALPSGELRIKKPSLKLIHDDKKLIDWAKAEAKEFVQEVTTAKLKWNDLKKNLDIVDGEVINKATGELLEVEGLGIIEDGEQFEIKF